MRLPLRESIGVLLAASLAAAPALADEIHLKGGGRVTGRVVERTATRLTIETGPGSVTLPMSRVEKIVEGRSAIEVFAERAAELAPSDVQGWAELARWAEERDLLTQARQAWQRVLSHDPGNAEANESLGRVALDGRPAQNMETNVMANEPPDNPEEDNGCDTANNPRQASACL